MRKKFLGYSEALAHGRTFSELYGVKVYLVSLHPRLGRDERTVYWLFSAAGNGGQFKTRWVGADCGNESGWYFGGGEGIPDEAQSVLRALPELEALPGRQESWYALVAANTAGWSHQERLLLAQRCDDGGDGVWHESWVLHKEKNPASPVECPCARCNPRLKKETQPCT